MMWPSLCRLRLALPLLGLVAALCNPVAHAGPFEIAISPSRFELPLPKASMATLESTKFPSRTLRMHI